MVATYYNKNYELLCKKNYKKCLSEWYSIVLSPRPERFYHLQILFYILGKLD